MTLNRPTVLILTLSLTAINIAIFALNLSARAKAEVAGKDWFDLAKDNDFRQAVAYVVGSTCIIGPDRAPGLSPKILCGN